MSWPLLSQGRSYGVDQRTFYELLDGSRDKHLFLDPLEGI
jgi:hypothetical protein